MIDGIVSIIVTVISGVLVFIIGQILTNIWLTPLRQYKELKKNIVFKLTYYANQYSNTLDLAKCSGIDERVEKYKDGSDELRMLSCSLKGFAETLYWFRIGIPSPKVLNDVADLIMGLSNSFFTPYNTDKCQEQSNRNCERVKKIFKLLKCQCKE